MATTLTNTLFVLAALVWVTYSIAFILIETSVFSWWRRWLEHRANNGFAVDKAVFSAAHSLFTCYVCLSFWIAIFWTVPKFLEMFVIPGTLTSEHIIMAAGFATASYVLDKKVHNE